MNRDRQQDDDNRDTQERPRSTCEGMVDVPDLIEEDD